MQKQLRQRKNSPAISSLLYRPLRRIGFHDSHCPSTSTVTEFTGRSQVSGFTQGEMTSCRLHTKKWIKIEPNPKTSTLVSNQSSCRLPLKTFGGRSIWSWTYFKPENPVENQNFHWIFNENFKKTIFSKNRKIKKFPSKIFWKSWFFRFSRFSRVSWFFIENPMKILKIIAEFSNWPPAKSFER